MHTYIDLQYKTPLTPICVFYRDKKIGIKLNVCFERWLLFPFGLESLSHKVFHTWKLYFGFVLEFISIYKSITD